VPDDPPSVVVDRDEVVDGEEEPSSSLHPRARTNIDANTRATSLRCGRRDVTA
jgi:hypothetical protein